LVLFEEWVRRTADHLRDEITHEEEAVERLHRFVVEYYRLCRPLGEPRTPANARPLIMAEFAQQMLTTHPRDAARAFVPLVALFEELLDEAIAARAIRGTLRPRPTVGVVLEVIMFNALSSTIGGSSVRSEDEGSAEELWVFVLHGMWNIPPS
jgi:AcrR family transcriptional regulator